MYMYMYMHSLLSAAHSCVPPSIRAQQRTT